MENYLVITGGSRGIGEKTIATFQHQGWQTINLSRSPCQLAGVVNIPIDLSSNTSITQQAALILNSVKDAQKIVLVHNATFYQPDRIDQLSLETLQTTLQTNIVACAALNNILLPVMTGGAIIYIGSTLAVKAVPGSASYIISKHALIGLMKATCQDLLGRAIHTCCICPGLVDTQLLKEVMDEATIDYLLNNVIIGKRLIEPQEIADLIYFCANTNIINGATLQANLGQVAD